MEYKISSKSFSKVGWLVIMGKVDVRRFIKINSVRDKKAFKACRRRITGLTEKLRDRNSAVQS